MTAGAGEMGARVSVLTPFLNAEAHLADAVESVLGQTYADWELLLIDDGSTDGSTAIARRYAERHPEKIRYLEHDGHRNLGVSASRNLGVAQARGELLAFVDADDMWLPHKLAHQVPILDQNPEVGLVCNPVWYWYADTGGRRVLQAVKLAPGKHPPGVMIYKMIEDNDNATHPSGALTRRELVARVGGFEESLRIGEDTAMWHKIAVHTPIYYDPEPVAIYRKHAASTLGAVPFEERWAAEMPFHTWLMRFLEKQRRQRGGFDAELGMARSHIYTMALRHLVHSRHLVIALALVQGREMVSVPPPQDAEWYYMTAYGLHQLQTRLSEALRRYSLSLDHGFDEFWVRYHRGTLYDQLGDRQQAQADLRRAAKLQPHHPGVQQLLDQMEGPQPPASEPPPAMRERVRRRLRRRTS